MGDVAMTVPVLRTLSQTYPKVKLIVLTRRFFAPIFSDIDNLQVYYADVTGEHKGIVGLIRLARSLKKLQIDVVADLHSVLRSYIIRNFFFMVGTPVAQIDKGRAEKKALTRARNKVFKPLKTTCQRYADVFANLGYPIDLATHKFPKRKPLAESIIRLTTHSKKKWIGIAPFAQYESKTYPLPLMIKVIEALNKENQVDIFLFGGGKKEKDICNTISSKYSNVINVAGVLSFEDELALISNLDVMLSMDSGNGHLAAMYGVPTITLWGVTHPFAGFMPFGQPIEHAILPDLVKYDQIPTSIYGNKIPLAYKKVMHTIHPDKILDAIQSILDK